MTLINREDAIDELRRLIPYKKYHRGEWVYLLDKREVFKAINALPSAEVETKCVAQIKVDTEEIVRRIKEEYDIMGGWIPCSEGLPKKGEVVLITNGKGNVRCGQYRSEHDVRGGTHYWWWKGKTVETVIAWMPLPEPYREDGE